MSTSNNHISNLISQQLPFFVRNDHQTFVAFMEAYYEYLEENVPELNQGRITERAENLLDYIDVDKTLGDFSNKFYTNFLSLIPNTITTDKEIVIKNIKDFYRSKGSEKSLKFLLRLLSDGQNADIYYPKVDILRASDGKWFVQKSLRVEDTRINGTANNDFVSLQNFVSKSIRGNTSNASATIEKIDRFYENGTLINELIISSEKGIFENGETVFTTFSENGTIKSITANVFGGILNSIKITNPGTGYSVGDNVGIESNVGTGAIATVTQVSSGNISSIILINGGAGFKAEDLLLISGGGGSGANGNVITVDTSGRYHPNSYNIYTGTIQLEANTLLGNSVYSNLNQLITTPNANTTLINSLSSYVYSNVGPISSISLLTRGQNYTSIPSIDAVANSTIKSLGILGRMNVISRGISYTNGDIIEFMSSHGFGANAIVANTFANGAINTVSFTANSGWVIGGFGYIQSELPTCNIRTSTGSGGAIEVTAILGDGETIDLTTSVLGAIEKIGITNRGQNYTIIPTINLTSSGDGTAQAVATIVSGVYKYDGRYLNDDGHLSSYNFLQNRDYYQNFSYVVKIKKSLDEYKSYVENIIHPGGMKLFGEYMNEDNGSDDNRRSEGNTDLKIKFVSGMYLTANNSNGQNVIITYANNGVSNNETIYLEFDGASPANLSNGIFTTRRIVNANTFIISHPYTIAGNTGNVLFGRVI